MTTSRMASSGVRRRTSYHAPRRTWQFRSPRTRAHCGLSGMPCASEARRRQPRRRALKASTVTNHKPTAITASSHHANDLRFIRAPFACRCGNSCAQSPRRGRVRGWSAGGTASTVDRARCRCGTATGRFRSYATPRRSRLRYCIASPTCLGSSATASSRSATVRAILRMR